MLYYACVYTSLYIARAFRIIFLRSYRLLLLLLLRLHVKLICKIWGRGLDTFIVDETRLSNTIKPMSDVCFIVTSVRHAMYSYREWPIITWPYRFMTCVHLNIYILIVFILINVYSHFYRIILFFRLVIEIILFTNPSIHKQMK